MKSQSQIKNKFEIIRGSWKPHVNFKFIIVRAWANHLLKQHLSCAPNESKSCNVHSNCRDFSISFVINR